MRSTEPVLVTGGTGTLGRLVVPRLRDAGYRVRVLSRHPQPSTDGIHQFEADLLAGTGIEPAVAGVHTVLHLAGGAKGDAQATHHLVTAAAAAGVQHLVYISVIGADRMPLGYFRNKLGAEQAVSGSGIPWTTLRAAQFHELVLTMGTSMSRLPVIPAPAAVRFQSVAGSEVAGRLVELALAEPAGLVADLPGPEVLTLPAVVRSVLHARGKHRPLLPMRLPGKAGKAYRAGENLSAEPAVGKQTWAEFLAGADSLGR